MCVCVYKGDVEEGKSDRGSGFVDRLKGSVLYFWIFRRRQKKTEVRFLFLEG